MVAVILGTTGPLRDASIEKPEREIVGDGQTVSRDALAGEETFEEDG